MRDAARTSWPPHVRGRAERVVPRFVQVQRTFPAHARSAGDARRFVADALRQWGCDGLVDTATLLVSELVTNALLHARTDIDVHLGVSDDELRVEVHDLSPVLPRPRRYSLEASTGRGLHLLETVATDWGVQATAGGKAMWFTISTMYGESDDVEPVDFDVDAVPPL